MTKMVKENSGGQLKITEGALYPALHKLERKGMLSVKYTTVKNRKRKYYILTPEGGKYQKSKLQDFKDFVKSMWQVLNPKIA